MKIRIITSNLPVLMIVAILGASHVNKRRFNLVLDHCSAGTIDQFHLEAAEGQKKGEQGAGDIEQRKRRLATASFSDS